MGRDRALRNSPEGAPGKFAEVCGRLAERRSVACSLRREPACTRTEGLNASARRAQSRESGRDEPANRGLGHQAAACGEGVEAIARKLIVGHPSRKLPDIDWRIPIKRGQLKAMPVDPRKALYEWFERRKAQMRAIVEHPFHSIKNLFGYRKASSLELPPLS